MTDVKNCDLTYPHFTPEPHCIPGYTGYLPGFGPHKLYQFGKTFANMTYDIMKRHPVAGERFGNIKPRNSGGEQNHQFGAWRHEGSMHQPILRYDMVSGYTGHVPRKQFHPCRSYRVQCQKGIAEFKKLKMDVFDKTRSYSFTPPDDLLPRDVTFSQRLCDRPKHRAAPSYATFINPMNYGQSVYEMSDLDPRKTYMPGYTGYYTGKCFNMGVTHGRGAHEDLCDLTSSKLERLVAEKRPKINDWYRCPVLYPPRVPVMDGYHPPVFKTNNPVPGYAGHIPGYRDSDLAQPYGKVAKDALRDRELRSSEKC